MKRLTFLLALLLGLAAVAAELPYNEAANAKAEIAQALADAAKASKPVLVIFGANWCEDCRALDLALKSGKNAALMSEEFKVVKVDVGRFDRNLDIANAYGNPIKKGIPAAVIVASDNRVLYATRAGELADARSMNADGIYGFFRDAMAKAKASH
ncbi:MAG: thioredoxin family protein [Betaproteobacteria bacterium]|jgi:protein disulfide-isomerase|nr:MAG: thioredoxin family protein [Betaproteobacteria bacterium]